MDQPQLQHGRLEAVSAHLMVDAMCFAQQLADFAPLVGREIAANLRAQVGSLADVEHFIASITEQIDAGLSWQPVGQLQFVGLGTACKLGKRDEVFEPQYSQRGSPLEKKMQQVSGCQRVVKGAMAGFVA